MSNQRYDVLGLGNAIVDVIAPVDDDFLAKSQLRKGGMQLVDEEQALALYEQGIALANLCTRKLEEAELRVRQWQSAEQTVPVEGWQEG